MKKIVLLFATVLISAAMFGQFHFGPQIGYTASNLTVNRSEIVNNLKNNLLIGVFARFGNKIYVQPEVNWLTQGSVFKYEFDISNPNPVEQNIKISSLQVPVSIGWRIINLKVVNIRVFGGVTANFALKTTINTTNGNGSEYLVPDDFKSVYWQWQAGLGVDVFMFAIDVKYLGGMSNVFSKDIQYDNETHTLSSKSNLFEVTVGWKIF